jgi:AcrR family transcriptional regulator
MATTRRPRAATEEKRTRVLDATEEIMLEDGYAAVSSRSVAGRVGINPPLVHYYFGSLDDLFVAVLHRRGGTNVERMTQALESDEPLRTWWRLVSDPRGAALFIELIAAGNHRPALQDALGEYARDVRRMQIEKLESLLPEYGISGDEVPPALVAAAMQGLAFGLVADQTAGHDTATDEAAAGMDRLLTRLEEQRRRRPGH